MFDVTQIFKWWKKNITGFDIAIFVGLIVLFLSTRLIKLDGFPIFSDEGIYIHWARVAWHDANWRFISLTDGRQPLQTWLTIPFLKLSADNLLLGGRLFGVFAGFIALSGILVTTWYLFSKKIAYIASFLYIITPFFLFFDRLAMIDSMVNASCIWIFFLSIVLIQTVRLDVALILGMMGGLFLLAKSNASMFLALSIFAPILDFQKKITVKKVINYLLLYGLAGVIAVALYNIQRLSPFFHFVNEKNYTFILRPSEFLHDPFQIFWQNLPIVPLYTFHNLGWASGILGLYGLFLVFKKNKFLGIYISLWLILPYTFMVFFNRVLFSRYHIFMLSFLVILAAYGIFHLYQIVKNKTLLSAILIIAYAFTFYFSYTVMFDYKNIPFLTTDRGQYLEGWPAGWGAKEIMEFAREKSLKKHVTILAEGNFGMTGDVLDTFWKDTDNITIRGSWPLGEKEIVDSQKELYENYVYVVFAHQDTVSKLLPLRLIKKYEKPGNKSSLQLYEVTK